MRKSKVYSSLGWVVGSLLFLFIVFIFCGNGDNSEINTKYVAIAKNELEKRKVLRKDFVIMVDYSKPVSSERLFLVDVKNEKIILSSRVSHALNSGWIYPSKFSNTVGSEKSSIGCYVTKGEKWGRFGYSMVVDGLEKGMNDNAKKRAIIFHSTKWGFTPWSKGCFVTSKTVNASIIRMTKNGCLVVVLG